jgi:hypothetical protein
MNYNCLTGASLALGKGEVVSSILPGSTMHSTTGQQPVRSAPLSARLDKIGPQASAPRPAGAHRRPRPCGRSTRLNAGQFVTRNACNIGTTARLLA